MNSNIKKVALGVYGMWGALGFYRGTQYYYYRKRHNFSYIYTDGKEIKNVFNSENDTYAESIPSGIIGIAEYIIPPFTLFSIAHELYKLEICLTQKNNLKYRHKYYSTMVFLFDNS